jgi:flagellar hook-basal body complex protein FliE
LLPSAAAVAAEQPAFKNVLKNFVEDVNRKLTSADAAGKDLAAGRTNDVNHVVISVEEAQLSLQFLMAVRNKLLEAYTEIQRMSA